MCDLTCALINLQKSKAASTELNKRDYKLAFITEPNCYNGRVRMLDAAHGDIHAHVGGVPRAALRVAKDLAPWNVTDFTDEDMCTVAFKIDGSLVYVCSAYLDIKFDIRKPLMVRLMDECEDKRIPLIIGMDSNAHSTLWGCQTANKRGTDLEDLLISKHFVVANLGDTPTYKRINAE